MINIDRQTTWKEIVSDFTQDALDTSRIEQALEQSEITLDTNFAEGFEAFMLTYLTLCPFPMDKLITSFFQTWTLIDMDQQFQSGTTSASFN